MLFALGFGTGCCVLLIKSALHLVLETKVAIHTLECQGVSLLQYESGSGADAEVSSVFPCPSLQDCVEEGGCVCKSYHIQRVSNTRLSTNFDSRAVFF